VEVVGKLFDGIPQGVLFSVGGKVEQRKHRGLIVRYGHNPSPHDSIWIISQLRYRIAMFGASS
jgi:hypothetical protein